ncbi:MAG: hypothetical protein ACE15B_03855 [Bryobacteraceae bacterium]
MLNFRDFQAGPYQVRFGGLQTGIAPRHSDTVDVRFLLEREGARESKTIAMPHAGLVALSRQQGRALADPWCARIAAVHLREMIETGADMEKPLVTLSEEDLERHAAEVAEIERQALV